MKSTAEAGPRFQEPCTVRALWFYFWNVDAKTELAELGGEERGLRAYLKNVEARE
jgi:hypothetical protein